MSLYQNLLYLLLLYAVLDRQNNLSLTKGLIIAFGIMLFYCYHGRMCCGNNRISTSNNGFNSLNGI